MADLTGQILDDKYRIDRRLGEGGMGAVYLAIHLGTERPVALKVISARYMTNEEFVERFRREARAAGRLIHPNVVNVTDFGFARVDSHRVAYLVMEYLDGCTLADVLAEESKLPLGWVVDIVEQVCSAIDEAHRQGILHRDLKPDNIWLEPNRRGGYTAKVLDFGLAKLGETSGAPAGEISQVSKETASKPSLPPPGSETSTQVQNRGATRAEDTATQIQNSNTPQRDEAATQIQTASSAQPEETATRIQQADGPAEDATRIMTPPDATAAIRRHTQVDDSPRKTVSEKTPEPREDQATLLVDSRGTAGGGSLNTASAEGLTQVGSVLGTPLYMSPEQCLGRTLDARSDIYSLGVITYQMLTGETPFRGDLDAVMRGHIESPPPPIRGKSQDVPKKVAAVVMSALSKNPDERPETAEALASALRSNAEGIGPLLRRAFALYSEHFPTFLRVSLLVGTPMIVIGILQFITAVLTALKKMPDVASIITSIALGLLFVFFSFLSSAVTVGVTVRLVTQFLLAPLRPIKLRPAFEALKKRVKAFLVTTLLVVLINVLGYCLCIIPGLIFQINYSLAAPVVLMEGLSGWAAMRRSTALVKRARRTVIMVVIVQILLPLTLSTMINVGFALLGTTLTSNPATPEWLATIAKIIKTAPSTLISPILSVLITPLISIFTALLYLKTRLAGGESLHEVLEEIEDHEVPTTRWQQRMQQRLVLTPTTSDHRNKPLSDPGVS